MGVYLKEFENHTQYESFTADIENFIKPNVSLCVQENEVHFNPYVPPRMNIITYTASAKLNETTGDYPSNGLHTDIFSGANGKLTIINHTFENGVGTIEFSDDVTSIGNWAFYHCNNMTSINIPNSVTTIGYQAFCDCSFTSIDIPSGVTSISSNTFYGCRNLTSIDIPSGVTHIYGYLFAGCTNLASVTIPSGVTNIDYNAFAECSSLTSIDIPSGVTNIANQVFQGCTSLARITCKATTAPTIGNDTFQDIVQNGTLYVPIGSSGYDVWMGTGDYYLGKYGWTKVEQ